MSNTVDLLYKQLQEIIPTLPKNPIKLKLTLEVDKIPTIEVTSYLYESGLLTHDTKIQTFELTEIES